MPNRQGRKPRQPGSFSPRGALPEGNVAVPRISGETQAAAGRALAVSQEAASAAMGALSTKLGQWADKAAAIEGARAGAVAGMDPEFRPEGRTTIRGQAFERAAIQTYADQLDAQMRTDIASVADANAGNPAALERGFAALRQEYRQQHLFPEIAGAFDATFQRATLGPMRQAHRAVQAKAKADRLAALEASLAERSKGLNRLAYSAGLDAEADAAIAGELTDLRVALEATGPDGLPLVDPKAAGQALRNATMTAARARVLGTFDRLESLDAKERFIEQFEADFREGADHLDAFDVDDFERLRGTMRAGASRARTEGNRAIGALSKEVKSFEGLAAKGFAPDDEQLEDLMGRVAATGDETLIARMTQATATFATLRAASQARPADLEAWTNSERARLAKEGASEPELNRLELVETLADTMRTELERDPIGWAQRTGTVAVMPFNFTEPDEPQTGARGFAMRHNDALAIAEHYGVAPKFFTRAEREALAVQFQQGDPETRLQIAAGIADGFGDDAPAALGEIAVKAPAAAYLAGLVALGPQHVAAARDGYRGLQVLREGTIGVPETRARELAGEALGEALDSRLSSTRNQIYEAAKAIYAARALDQAVTGFDEELFGEALHAAAGAYEQGGITRGGIGQFNGRSLILPQHMSEGDFTAAIEGLTDADLARLSASGGLPTHRNIRGQAVKATAEDLQGAYFVSVGPGRYQVSTTDPSLTPGFLLDAETGQYWEIDLAR